MVWLCRTDDRRGDERFVQHPRQRDLRCGNAAVRGNFVDTIDHESISAFGLRV